MKDPKEIQQEVEATLRALDDARPVEARPFFFTRLEGRMAAAPRRQPAFRWQWAALALLLMLNAGSIAWSLNSSSKKTTSPDYATAFSGTYGLEYSDGWGLNE